MHVSEGKFMSKAVRAEMQMWHRCQTYLQENPVGLAQLLQVGS